MIFTQIETFFVMHSADANTKLRQFQVDYPLRKIINVNMAPTEMGWFMTIVYEVSY